MIDTSSIDTTARPCLREFDARGCAGRKLSERNRERDRERAEGELVHTFRVGKEKRAGEERCSRRRRAEKINKENKKERRSRAQERKGKTTSTERNDSFTRVGRLALAAVAGRRAGEGSTVVDRAGPLQAVDYQPSRAQKDAGPERMVRAAGAFAPESPSRRRRRQCGAAHVPSSPARSALEALAVHDRRAGLVVLVLGDPHALERGLQASF